MATPPSLLLLVCGATPSPGVRTAPRKAGCAACRRVPHVTRADSASLQLRDPGHPAAIRPFRSHDTAFRASAACERQNGGSAWRPVVRASA